MSSFVNLLEIIYPIGSCYFSTDSTSPSEFIGGTWEQMTGGVLGLVGSTGVASAGENGGSTKISIDQLPSHDHSIADSAKKNKSGTAYQEAAGYGITQTSAFRNRLVVTHDYKTPDTDTYIFTALPAGGARLHSCSHCCLWVEAYRLGPFVDDKQTDYSLLNLNILH